MYYPTDVPSVAPSENRDDDFEFPKSTITVRCHFPVSDWDHDYLANDSPMKILGDKEDTILDTPSGRVHTPLSRAFSFSTKTKNWDDDQFKNGASPLHLPRSSPNKRRRKLCPCSSDSGDNDSELARREDEQTVTSSPRTAPALPPPTPTQTPHNHSHARPPSFRSQPLPVYLSHKP